MDRVSPFLFVTLPFVVITAFVNRKAKGADRRRVALVLVSFVVAGAIGSLIGGDAGLVVSIAPLLPIRLLNRDRRRRQLARQGDDPTWVPWATIVLCIVLAGVFVAQLVHGPFDDQHLLDMGAIETGNGVHVEWWRAFTAAYLHGGVAHLLFNTIALLALARRSEGRIGRAGFVLAWLVTSTGSLVAVGLFQGGEPAVTVGASGGAMGMLGVGIATLLLDRRTGTAPAQSSRDLRFLAGIAVFQVAMDTVVPNVSQIGHLAGLVLGLVVGAAWHLATRPRIAPATS